MRVELPSLTAAEARDIDMMKGLASAVYWFARLDEENRRLRKKNLELMDEVDNLNFEIREMAERSES